jgi:2-oxoglutarate ferredoxin oxidoreductase subunit beta
LQKVFTKPASLIENTFHFCPGCHHGIVHRLICEAIDFYQIREKTVGVVGVGCCVFMYNYIDVDVCEAPHGRAPAVATGIKRVQPQNITFTYQGDGDLCAIGMSEVVHAANRGENITVIFVNNNIYGMTGGQMAPTTLLGQQTTTSPYGRDFQTDGYPVRMPEMLATLEGVAFAARVTVHTAAQVKKARKAVMKAFEMQIKNMGFSFVEFISACPTNWRLSPQQSVERIEEEVLPYYSPGIFKERKTPDYL